MTLVAFIVEDSQTILDALIPSLEELTDAKVAGVAESEKDAIAWFVVHQGRWDLAVVDIFLKQGSGLGVLAAIQGRDSCQRAVVLTNYPTKDMRQQAAALGANAVFDKSTELEAFFRYAQVRH